MLPLLDAPLKYLPRYLLPRTIEEAEDYLSRRLETATLFFVCDQHLPLIFEKRFPREWAADQEKILPPDADTPYSEGELKCLELIAEHLFPFAYEHLAYSDAGHGIGRPYTSTMDISHVTHPLTGRVMSLGGTPSGTAKAREDSWRHTLEFLDKHLNLQQP